MGSLGWTRWTELCMRGAFPDIDGGVLPSGREEGEGDREAALPFTGEGGADCTGTAPTQHHPLLSTIVCCQDSYINLTGHTGPGVNMLSDIVLNE